MRYDVRLEEVAEAPHKISHWGTGIPLQRVRIRLPNEIRAKRTSQKSSHRGIDNLQRLWQEV